MLIDVQRGALTDDLCDRLICRLDEADLTGISAKPNEGWRRCTMHALTNPQDPLAIEFAVSIRAVFENYKRSALHGTQWGTLNACNRLESPNIIRYTHDQLFEEHADVWHAESCTRQVAFVAYLNDVKLGGGTRFTGHNIVVKPERGAVACYPAFFTHMHRAEPPISGDKYVVVTWAHFPPSGYASMGF